MCGGQRVVVILNLVLKIELIEKVTLSKGLKGMRDLA